MKRGATRQIQREDGEDPHAVEGGDEEGQVATSAPSGERVIRDLPKRKGFGAAAPSAASNTTPSFSFGSPTGSAAPPPAAAASSTPSFSFGPPAVASSTSQAQSPPATNPFGSFGGFGASKQSETASKPTPSTGGFNFSAPKPAPASSTPGSTATNNVSASTATGTADGLDVDYYLSLRGLNHSLKSAISKALELNGNDDEQEFADLAPALKGVLAKYEEKRAGIVASKSSASTSSAPSTSSTASQQPQKAGGFSFGTPAAQSSAPVKPLEADSAKKTEEVKAKAQAPAAGLPTFSVPIGGFSFAGQKVADAVKASDQPVQQPKDLPKFDMPSGGFSFGGKKVDWAAASGKTNRSELEVPVSNGSKASSPPQPEQTKPAATSTNPFGAGSSGPAATSKTPAFSFGSAPKPMTNAFGSTPSFGFGRDPAVPSSSSDISSPPSAGASVTSSTAPAPKSGFGFGGFGSANTAASSAGSPGAATTGFSFGGSSTSKPAGSSGGFSFANPSSNVNQPGLFDFGKAGGKIAFGGEGKGEDSQEGTGGGEESS
ncbi:unnamed protein product [Parajaminaea phylloscopi]